MARARKASQTQSKIGMILFGEEGTGKSSLALQFALLKRPDGKPFRVLYIDNENGSIDDFIEGLEQQGINIDNIYIVYTQSLAETREYINTVKSNTDFYELDEDGNQTDNVVLDADGQPFRADAIVVDGTSILKLTSQQGLLELSKKRNAVKAKADGLIGDDKFVKVEGAGLELKDYNALNFKGQDLILDLMSCGAHYIVTARETDEKQTVKDAKGSITSISTGKKIPDGFKGMMYNVKTVVRMYKDEDGNYCAYISKDRTGVHNNETVEDLTLLDWQPMIDKTKDNDKFVIKNDLTKAVNIEQQMLRKEYDKSIGETEDNSPDDSGKIDELKSSINEVMRHLFPDDKNKAKKALTDAGLPSKPSEIKAENNKEVLEKVLAIAKDCVKSK